MKSQQGITLIELMIVVVIVAILASIAVPSYSAYIVRSNRRAAQATMMEIAARQHQLFAANRAYAASAADLGYTLPPEVAAHYAYSVALNAGPPPSFTITMTPSGRQAADGALTLTSAGVKGPAGKW
ncbi:MAG: type IV pilin protein [Rhodospirillaceae bacterium]